MSLVIILLAHGINTQEIVVLLIMRGTKLNMYTKIKSYKIILVLFGFLIIFYSQYCCAWRINQQIMQTDKGFVFYLKIIKDTSALSLQDQAADLAILLKELAEDVSAMLTALDISNDDIGVDGAAVVADFLRTNRTLIMLNIAGNNVGDKGVKTIVEALQANKNTALAILNICGNSISNEGAEAVADLLRTNKTLTTVDLSWNNIADEGARIIAGALRENLALTTIDLNDNSITDEGAQYFWPTRSGHKHPRDR
jgi:hypothetical protein